MKSELEFVILGCGSSGGVPRLGGADGSGNWGACDPGNPKNRRTRCSALVRRRGTGGVTNVLIDTSPDMREQLLTARVTHLDGVLITHDRIHIFCDFSFRELICRKVKWLEPLNLGVNR